MSEEQRPLTFEEWETQMAGDTLILAVESEKLLITTWEKLAASVGVPVGRLLKEGKTTAKGQVVIFRPMSIDALRDLTSAAWDHTTTARPFPGREHRDIGEDQT